MIIDIFYSKQNKNAIKSVLNENIGINNSNKYDIIIEETMNYVSSQVSHKPPKGVPEDEYLMLMNKKVYDIIKPIIKTDIQNNKKQVSQIPNVNKNIDLYNQYQEFQKNDENLKNKQNKQYMQYKQQNSDNIFDPILLKNYETPAIIDYPKPATIKLNNENSNVQITNLENEREQITPKLKPIDFTINNDNSNRPNTTKLYNDLLSTYNTQISNMVEYDNNKKKADIKTTQLIDLLTNDNLSTPIEQFTMNEDLFNKNTILNSQFNNALNISVNDALNTSVNNALNTSVNNALKTSFNYALKTYVNNPCNSANTHITPIILNQSFFVGISICVS
jgi:hypothetical protein